MRDKEYTVDELLTAREKRVELIGELLRSYNNPLVFMRVNYPGLKKTNDLTVHIIEEMSRLICRKLSKNIRRIGLFYGAEGPVFYAIVDEDIMILKAIAIDVEEKHILGRCLDLDVYDREGRSLSRQELGYSRRKCYLCEDDAHNCVRARRHSESEVIEYIEGKYNNYKGTVKNNYS